MLQPAPGRQCHCSPGLPHPPLSPSVLRLKILDPACHLCTPGRSASLQSSQKGKENPQHDTLGLWGGGGKGCVRLKCPSGIKRGARAASSRRLKLGCKEGIALWENAENSFPFLVQAFFFIQKGGGLKCQSTSVAVAPYTTLSHAAVSEISALLQITGQVNNSLAQLSNFIQQKKCFVWIWEISVPSKLCPVMSSQDRDVKT